jgi:hypothetical protein
MRRASITLSTLALGCATRGGLDPSIIASHGDALEGAPRPGEAFATTLTSIEGERIAVPDPEGRVVVLELIRSADW